jgi:hypothetical protein
MVQTDAGGTLRIRAKSLGSPAPGTRTSTKPAGVTRQYCHLIAPDYLKRILVGEVPLPAAGMPVARSNGR